MNLKNCACTRILGIDPGSAICGWAVIESERGEDSHLIASGCIKTHKKDSTAKRLQILHDELSSVIKKYHPAEAAVEQLFFVQNVKTGIAVGQARGVVLLALSQADIKIFEYEPTQVKLALVGYGRADKRQVQSMVKLILKLDKVITQDDEADAVAIAICHINHANHANRTRITPESKRQIETRKSKILYPELSYKIVGILQRVSNTMGFVAHERQYYPAIERQLDEQNIKYKKQVPVRLSYSYFRGRFYIDYVIDDLIALEIKVGSRYTKQDVDQLMGYLRATGKELGILARFTRTGVDFKRFLLGNK